MHNDDDVLITRSENRRTALSCAVQGVPKDERAIPEEVIIVAEGYLMWLERNLYDA